MTGDFFGERATRFHTAGSLDGIKIGLIHSEESMLQIATFLKSTQVCRWCWILSWLLKKRLQFMKKIHAVID